MHVELLVELRMHNVGYGFRVWNVTPRIGREIHDQRFPRLRNAEVQLVVGHFLLHAADVHQAALRIEAAEREVVLGHGVLVVARPLAPRAGHLLVPEADQPIEVTRQAVERERLEANELVLGLRGRWLVWVGAEAWSFEVAVAASDGEHAGNRDRGERGGNANTHGLSLRLVVERNGEDEGARLRV